MLLITSHVLSAFISSADGDVAVSLKTQAGKRGVESVPLHITSCMI
jgi:hypothetical protein